eukprot:NODE_956_length_2771_cov_0.098054.p1 type:complete len:548 gc:universal NODE_956_length_2771_cov_0.098054:2665-1022(-)
MHTAPHTRTRYRTPKPRKWLVLYKEETPSFLMFIALLSLAVAATDIQNIYIPNTVFEDASTGSGFIVGQNHVYQVVGSKVQFNYNGNWVDCMDKPSGTAWTIEDVHKDRVLIVEYRAATTAEKASYMAANRAMIDIKRYVKSSSGCTIDQADNQGAEFKCAVTTYNVANMDTDFPMDSTTFQKVAIAPSADGADLYVVADMKTNTKELRIFSKIDLSSPADDGTCIGQMQSSTEKIVYFADDKFKFRTYDPATKIIEEIYLHVVFSSVGWHNFGSNHFPDAAITLPSYQACTLNLPGDPAILDISGSIGLNNQYTNFIAAKDLAVFLTETGDGSSNNCDSFVRKTTLTNIVYFRGQQAITYDAATKVMDVYYTKSPYDTDNLSFTKYITYADVESNYAVKSASGKILLFIQQVQRFRLLEFTESTEVASENIPTRSLLTTEVEYKQYFFSHAFTTHDLIKTNMYSSISSKLSSNGTFALSTYSLVDIYDVKRVNFHFNMSYSILIRLMIDLALLIGFIDRTNLKKLCSKRESKAANNARERTTFGFE